MAGTSRLQEICLYFENDLWGQCGHGLLITLFNFSDFCMENYFMLVHTRIGVSDTRYSTLGHTLTPGRHLSAMMHGTPQSVVGTGFWAVGTG